MVNISGGIRFNSSDQVTADSMVGTDESLARDIVALHYRRSPDMEQRYPPGGREKCIDDVGYHLRYLNAACVAQSTILFRDYIAWVKALFVHLKFPPQDIADSLVAMRDVLIERIGEDAAALPADIINAVLQDFGGLAHSPPSHLDDDHPLSKTAEAYLKALLGGRRDQAGAVIQAARDNGVPMQDIYLHILQPALREVGRLWQLGQISVAQEHFFTAATQVIMARFYDEVFSGPRNGLTMVAACVNGELHEIGMRMVADIFELKGWSTIYLGANTPPAGIVSMTISNGADVLALSATIASHVPFVRNVISMLRAHPQGKRVAVLVGGYPFNLEPALAQRIGADYWAPDACAAVQAAERAIAERTDPPPPPPRPNLR